MTARTDILMKDVFISWTGLDRRIKNCVVQYLESHGIKCVDSDRDCAGNYVEWSIQSVSACQVFLPIITPNTLASHYVPLEIEQWKQKFCGNSDSFPDESIRPFIDMAAYLKLEDYRNRAVVLCSSHDLYKTDPWNLNSYASAVFFDGEPTEKELKAVCDKVKSLLINRYYYLYKKQTAADSIRLIPLFGEKYLSTQHVSPKRLYISRTLTEKSDDGQNVKCISNPAELLKNGNVLFVYGPAGSGKTEYIRQLRSAADKKSFVMSLSCARISDSSGSLFEDLYKEFCRICGVKNFYSEENFKRLLAVKHVILIFDGMDEIALESTKRKMLEKIENYAEQNRENLTLIFTGRDEADEKIIAFRGRTVRRFELNRLTEKETEKLADMLFGYFGSEEKKEAFLKRVRGLDEDIISNPMLLTQLAMVYEATGEVPENIAAICEAVLAIILEADNNHNITAVPEEYRVMIEQRLGAILKKFSKERFLRISAGKNDDAEKIFARVLKEEYSDNRERAAFLVEYLQSRAILNDGEFVHKLFLEYLAASQYYIDCFDEYDELANEEELNELFTRYEDPFWSIVLSMFLLKADSSAESVTELIRILLDRKPMITDYTLLFETAHEMIKNREAVQTALERFLLEKSVEGEMPPYGPFIWYTQQYECYEPAILAAAETVASSDALTAAKTLALVRDVCFLFAQKDMISQVTDRVCGSDLFQKAENALTGVRLALCELFFTGKTSSDVGKDIYPRCFNVAEAKSFSENGYGLYGIMTEPFEDELGMYRHESANEFGGEFVGFLSFPYNVKQIEETLVRHSTRKVCGLALSPTDNTEMVYIAFNQENVRLMYIPENCTAIKPQPIRRREKYISNTVLIEKKYFSFRSYASVPEGVTRIDAETFACCSSINRVQLPQSLKTVGHKAFYKCTGITQITVPDGVVSIGCYAFAKCENLSDISLPEKMERIRSGAFQNCSSIKNIRLPDGITCIDNDLFRICLSLEKIHIPDGVEIIKQFAFAGCSKLINVYLPESIKCIAKGVFQSCPTFHVKGNTLAYEQYSSCKGIVQPGDVNQITKAKVKNTASDYCDINKNEERVIARDRQTIKEYEFSNHKDFFRIVIPQSVTKIKTGAFQNCSELVSVRLSGKITRIFNRTFFECTRLQNIELSPDIEKIGPFAFAECYSLEHIDLPDKLTRIGNSAFLNCNQLNELIFPSCLTQICSFAFKNCTNLTEITIPLSVRIIGPDAFKGCTGLKSINISYRFENDIRSIFGDIDLSIVHFYS